MVGALTSLVVTLMLAAPEPWTIEGWRSQPARLVGSPTSTSLGGAERVLQIPLSRGHVLRVRPRQRTVTHATFDLGRLHRADREPTGEGWALRWTGDEHAQLTVRLGPSEEYALSLDADRLAVRLGPNALDPRPPGDAAAASSGAVVHDPLGPAGYALSERRYADVWRLLTPGRDPARRGRDAWFRADALRRAGLPLLAMDDYLTAVLHARKQRHIDDAIERLDAIADAYPGALGLVERRFEGSLPLDIEARAWWLLRGAQIDLRPRLVTEQGVVLIGRRLYRAAEKLSALIDHPLWAPRARLLIAVIAHSLGDHDAARHHLRPQGLDELSPRWQRFARVARARLAYGEGRLDDADVLYSGLAEDPEVRSATTLERWWLAIRRDDSSEGAARALRAIIPARIDGGPDDRTEALAVLYTRHCLIDRLGALAREIDAIELHDPLAEALAQHTGRLSEPTWADIEPLRVRAEQLRATLAIRRAVPRHTRRRLSLTMAYLAAHGRTREVAPPPQAAFGLIDGRWHDALAKRDALPRRCTSLNETDAEGIRLGGKIDE